VNHLLAKRLGARIRTLRQHKGMSQEELADRSSIHRSHLGEIERGESDSSISTLLRLSQGLDLSVSMLIKGVEDETTPQERSHSKIRKLAQTGFAAGR
jgi:transcriptional regulator with XRE-family HTH domain